MPRTPTSSRSGVVRAVAVTAVAAAVAGSVIWRWDDFAALTATSGELSEVLALLPADTVTVTYADSASTRERLGLDLARGDLAGGAAAYLEGTRQAPWLEPLGVPGLAAYATAMDDGAWSALDVEWSAQARTADGDTLSVLAVGDAVDEDEVAAELADHGFTESDVDGARSFTLTDLSALGEYALLPTLTFLGDGVFLVADAEVVASSVDVVRGDASSLADAGTFDDVVAGVAGIEVGILNTGTAVCDEGAAAAEEIRAGLPSQQPSATGAFLVPAGASDPVTAVARLAYADADAADAAVGARATYLADGLNLRTSVPLQDFIEDPQVSADGDVVEVDFALAGSDAVRVLSDEIVTACAPAE